MKNAKKVLVVVLAVVLAAASLAGCSKKTNTTTTKAASKTYVIYSDNSFAPFEYLDESTNKYTGLDMDLLAAIAADQGFKYEMHNEGFDAAMGAVQSGQADAMIAGMTITDKRKETYDFSDGYFDDGQIMVVKSDSSITSLDGLKGKTVAAKTSTMGSEYAESIKDKYNFKITYYEGSPEMYQAVTTGTAAACFEDKSVVLWAIKSEKLTLKTIGDTISPGQYGFAVKKGQNAELISMFNKGLANIKANGKYKEILAKYGN